MTASNGQDQTKPVQEQHFPREVPRAAEDSVETLNNRAVSLVNLGKQEEALAAWKEALAKHPGHLQSTYNRGLVLWRKGEESDSNLLTKLAECEAAAPDDPEVHLCIGHVHMEQARYGAAVEAFKRAEARNGGDEARLAREQAEALVSEEARCVRTFGEWKEVFSVSLSADGRWALSGGYDGLLRLWDLSARPGWCVRTFEGHTEHVSSVSLSADGRWALSGSRDKTVRLWDVSSGRCVRTFEGHTEHVNSVSLSADGRWALSGGYDGLLRLLDLSARPGRCMRTFEGHTGYVNSVSLSADGRWALSGSGGFWKDNAVRLWDVSSGQCMRTFYDYTEGVNSVSLSADGRWALLSRRGDQIESKYGIVRLWDLKRITVEHLRTPASLAICQVVTSAEALQNSDSLKAALEQAKEHAKSGNWHFALEAVRKARSINVGERNREALDLWHKAGLRSVRKGLQAAWYLRTFKGHTQSVNSVCFSADGRWALSGSRDKTLRLWDVSSGQSTRTFEGHTESVNSVCFSADGRWALSGSWDETLRLWEVSSGRCVRTFEGHTKSVESVCLSTDGRWALSGSRDKTLRLWKVSSGRCVRIFEGHTKSVESVCLSLDGRWALSGSDDCKPRLWEVASGRCVRTFKGINYWYMVDYYDEWFNREKASNHVNSVCLSLDGRWALSGSRDGKIQLWDVSSDQCMRTFEGHKEPVESVCLSTDGRWALSGSADKTLRLWEVASGRCVWTFEGHTGYVNSVSLSADGRWALSGSSDNTVRLWELDWDYEAREPAAWNKGAQSFLESFLTLHTPYASELPQDRKPSEEEINKALIRSGTPSWTEEDFQRLLHTLACAGYGWLRPARIKFGLEEFQRQQEKENQRKAEENRRRQEEKARLQAEENRRRQEERARRRAEEEERRCQEAEAWNRSLRGRITNFFKGKKKQ